MSYIQGFLIPVPFDKKAEYTELAEKSAPIFMEYGATRILESWGDDLQYGKVTDFKRAVKSEEGENTVFSWIEWPDKETYMAAAEKMESDPRWETFPEMPFDTKRMIWAGFEPIFETKT